jgi:hypothetical protein
MRRLPIQHHNAYVRRERDPRTLRRQARLLAACLMLAVGFVVAVKQQIAAVEYGYQTEALRRERESLLDEQRRLLLALEEHSSPANLERAARAMKLELQPARSAQIESRSRKESFSETRAMIVTTAAAGAVLSR